MKIEKLYTRFIKSAGICTDSRKAGGKKIFWALRGEHFDGNNFASKALDNGCSLAIVDKKDVIKDNRYIYVDNTLKALQDLAKHHRSQAKATIIAITGTNGKTTTKELLKKVLEQCYQVYCTEGNLNNHIGVPLTLLSLQDHHQYGIIEMGANHIGEIENLCNIAMPDYGIITNIGEAHIDGFGSIEGVITAKTELYDYLSKHGGKTFLNTDDKNLAAQIKNRNIEYLSYGSRKDNYCHAENISADPYLKFNLLLSGNSSCLEIKTRLIGDYNISNVLAAATTGWHFNVSPASIKKAIEAYQPNNNRSQLYKTKNNTLILDCYNANPTSMQLAINNFIKIDTQQKHLFILGDMLELGKSSEAEHKKILDLLKSKKIKNVLLVGEQFKSVAGDYGFTVYQNTDYLEEALRTSPYKGYYILIKGSRSNKLEGITPFL